MKTIPTNIKTRTIRMAKTRPTMRPTLVDEETPRVAGCDVAGADSADSSHSLKNNDL